MLIVLILALGIYLLLFAEDLKLMSDKYIQSERESRRIKSMIFQARLLLSIIPALLIVMLDTWFGSSKPYLSIITVSAFLFSLSVLAIDAIFHFSQRFINQEKLKGPIWLNLIIILPLAVCYLLWKMVPRSNEAKWIMVPMMVFIFCYWGYDYSLRSNLWVDSNPLMGVRCKGYSGRVYYTSIPKFIVWDAENLVISNVCPNSDVHKIRTLNRHGPPPELFKFIEQDHCLSNLRISCRSRMGEINTTWNQEYILSPEEIILEDEDYGRYNPE